MSVVNQFQASSIKVSHSERVAYVYAPGYANSSPFKYTFLCKSNFTCILFDMDRMRMLVVTDGQDVFSGRRYECLIMAFWVENDLPVPAVRWWQDQDAMIAKFGVEFKEKYGDYTLDNIINS